MSYTKIVELLGTETQSLLKHQSKTIPMPLHKVFGANFVKSDVINKQAGVTGAVLGKKAFQRPIEEGIKLLNNVQDVYQAKEIDLA